MSSYRSNLASLAVHTFPAEGPEDPCNPLVVLIHGGASSHRMYRTTIPILNANNYKVAAVDLPGHGDSADLGPFTFAKTTQLLAPAIASIKQENAMDVLIVGVSLGGQVVLDLLQNDPSLVEGAIVSGASIHPPDEQAQFEVPKLPTDQVWLDILTEDVKIVGIEHTAAIQNQSFAFTFDPRESLPPTLVVIGENDIPMARRDFEELAVLAKRGNDRSESIVLKNAWHNHPLDVPERFAALIEEWAQKIIV